MNIFDSLKQYAVGKWEVINTRKFNKDEQAAIREARVVASQYGNSVCFVMKSGAQTYIPLSNTSSLTVGESVDLSTARLLTLAKDGEADIYRVDA